MEVLKIAPLGSEKSQAKRFRFDIFRGVKDQDGKIQKLKSVGHALLFEGSSTYNVKVNTLLGVEFFLLPERKETERADYVILTREPFQRGGRRFYWHHVGEASFLKTPNTGLMEMQWDLFGHGDIYMSLYPIEIGARASEAAESNRSEDQPVFMSGLEQAS